MYRARIQVSLKPGHSDPEGEMTAQSLKELKYSVKKVGVSKVYEVIFEADSIVYSANIKCSSEKIACFLLFVKILTTG